MVSLNCPLNVEQYIGDCSISLIRKKSLYWCKIHRTMICTPQFTYLILGIFASSFMGPIEKSHVSQESWESCCLLPALYASAAWSPQHTQYILSEGLSGLTPPGPYEQHHLRGPRFFFQSWTCTQVHLILSSLSPLTCPWVIREPL